MGVPANASIYLPAQNAGLKRPTPSGQVEFIVILRGEDMNGVTYTDGMIIDIFPEGESRFRGCVKRQEIISGNKYVAAINLTTGEVSLVADHECSAPVINNIFTVDE